jgi:hypothetical protein
MVAPGGLFVCTTGFEGPEVADLVQRLRAAGHTYLRTLSLSTNILIVKKALSEKWSAAVQRQIPIVTENWIKDGKGGGKGDAAVIPSFLAAPLTGLSFSSTSLSASERRTVQTVVQQHGGRYSESLDKSCDYLVIPSDSPPSLTSPKLVFARRIGIPTLTSKALLKNIQLHADNVNPRLSDVSRFSLSELKCYVTPAEKVDAEVLKLVAATGIHRCPQIIPSTTHVIVLGPSFERITPAYPDQQLVAVSPDWLKECLAQHAVVSDAAFRTMLPKPPSVTFTSIPPLQREQCSRLVSSLSGNVLPQLIIGCDVILQRGSTTHLVVGTKRSTWPGSTATAAERELASSALLSSPKVQALWKRFHTTRRLEIYLVSYEWVEASANAGNWLDCGAFSFDLKSLIAPPQLLLPSPAPNHRRASLHRALDDQQRQQPPLNLEDPVPAAGMEPVIRPPDQNAVAAAESLHVVPQNQPLAASAKIAAVPPPKPLQAPGRSCSDLLEELLCQAEGSSVGAAGGGSTDRDATIIDVIRRRSGTGSRSAAATSSSTATENQKPTTSAALSLLEPAFGDRRGLGHGTAAQPSPHRHSAAVESQVVAFYQYHSQREFCQPAPPTVGGGSHVAPMVGSELGEVRSAASSISILRPAPLRPAPRRFLIVPSPATGGTASDPKETVLSLHGETVDIVDECTHLVLAKPAKTTTVLSALALGIWVLHPSYLSACRAAGCWVQEEEYEWSTKFLDESMRLLQSLVAGFKLQRLRGGQRFAQWRAIVVGNPQRNQGFSKILRLGGCRLVEQICLENKEGVPVLSGSASGGEWFPTHVLLDDDACEPEVLSQIRRQLRERIQKHPNASFGEASMADPDRALPALVDAAGWTVFDSKFIDPVLLRIEYIFHALSTTTTTDSLYSALKPNAKKRRRVDSAAP